MAVASDRPVSRHGDALFAGLRARMEALGSTRKMFKGGVFWDHKPDFRPGEVVEL
jgi:hypothetical protein